MKTLNLITDLSSLTLTEEDKGKSSQELVTTIVKNVILTWGMEKRGLNEEDRRKFYKISDAFELALKEKKEFVDLEDDWIGFLRKVFREANLMPNNLLRKVEELINEIKDR